MLRRTFGFLSIFFVLTVSSAQAQNLVQNGSFETGAFANSGDGFMSLNPGSTVINNWTTTTSNVAWGENGNSYDLTTPDGSMLLDLTGYDDAFPYGGVTQTIATVGGQRYTLGVDLGVQLSFGAQSGPIAVNVAADSTNQTFTYNPSGVGNQWQHFGFDFTAGGTSTVISIVGEAGKQYIGVDNVTVINATSPVPEPGSVALLVGMGLSGAGFLARRRNNAR